MNELDLELAAELGWPADTRFPPEARLAGWAALTLGYQLDPVGFADAFDLPRPVRRAKPN